MIAHRRRMPEGAILPVLAQPGARRNAILGERAGALRVAVTAPPERARPTRRSSRCSPSASAARPSQVALLSGETSRQKRFLIDGIDARRARRRRLDRACSRVGMTLQAERAMTPTDDLDDPTIPTPKIADRALDAVRRPGRSVRVPGSKSLTNRALIVAALADGPSVLTGALDSDDTRVMVEALRRLGIAVEHDPARRRSGSRAAAARSPRARPTLFVANSGTSLRFLTAMLATGQGTYRLDGTPRMRQRPVADLLDGAQRPGRRRPERPRDRLPAGHGPGQRARRRLCVRQGRRLEPVPERPADGPALFAATRPRSRSRARSSRSRTWR